MCSVYQPRWEELASWLSPTHERRKPLHEFISSLTFAPVPLTWVSCTFCYIYTQVVLFGGANVNSRRAFLFHIHLCIASAFERDRLCALAPCPSSLLRHRGSGRCFGHSPRLLTKTACHQHTDAAPTLSAHLCTFRFLVLARPAVTSSPRA